MKNLTELDQFRDSSAAVIRHFGTAGDSTCGVFFPNSQLKVIASSGEGWDHVSVSRRDRCPSWEEMEFVKRLFFKDDETAMQLHVPPTKHINNHPYVLHLWRPQGVEIPLPPPDFV